MEENNVNIKKKICGVCGDTAFGRNFGAITCESCKAFFRRTAFKTKGLNCSTNGKCCINIQNRRSCKKCRLNKCLSVGMIKELILKNNDKVGIDSSVKSERDLVNSICCSVDSAISISNDSTLFDEFKSVFENCFLSDEELNAEIMEIEEFINSPTTSIESENMEQKSAQMSIIPVVRPIATFNKGLNDIELSRLQEITQAIKCVRLPFSTLTQNIIEFPHIREYYTNDIAINMFDETARQYVKFCKRLSSFKEICQDDQLALIKYGYFESLSWQIFESFNFNEENWSMNVGNGFSLRFSLKTLKSSENKKVYNVTSKFVKKIGTCDWKIDSTILNLLTVVALFNPNRANVNHKELVKLKQQTYIYLLQRYLMQKYRSYCESIEKCSKIMNTMEDMEVVAKTQKESEKCYKQYMTPLLRELLD